MGMYTSVRFKGVIKPEYVDGFEDIALHGKWEESKHEIFRGFGRFSRASFIPCGALSYCWWDDGGTVFTKAWYGLISGYWQFECSLKNYEGEIEAFMEMIPEFVQELYHFEKMNEGCEYSTLYELKNGVLTPSGKYAWNKFGG